MAKCLLLALAACLPAPSLHAEPEEPIYNDQPLGQWISKLEDREIKVRKDAAFALGQMGLAARSAIPALVRALTDDDPEVRDEVIQALVMMGPAAVGHLTEALAHKKACVREMACIALAALRGRARAAVPGLDTALTDSVETVRVWAAVARWHVARQAEPVLPVLEAALKSPDADLRVQAVFTLGQLGPDAAPALCLALADGDPEIQTQAAATLGALGTGAAPAVPDLVRLLRSPNAETACAAAGALGQIGPKAAAAVPALIQVWHAPQREWQMPAHMAAWALGQIGRDALPALRQALAERKTRALAGEALLYMGPPALPLLEETLSHRKSFARVEAAQTLGRMGRTAWPSRGRLAMVLNDGNGLVRVRAAEALWRIDRRPQPVLPVLGAALTEPRARVRAGAADVLAQFGPVARSLLPVVVAATGDADPGVAAAAERAREAIAPRPQGLRALANAQPSPENREDRDGTGRAGSFIAVALRKRGREALPTVREALRHPDVEVRLIAADALSWFDGQAGDAVPVLIAALKEQDEPTRSGAALVLGQFGPDARPAIPALRQALRDGSPEVRLAAADALGRIGCTDGAVVATAVDCARKGMLAVGPQWSNQFLWPSDTLKLLGPAAVPALVEALQAESLEIEARPAKSGRLWASPAHLLGEIGADARRAVPALWQILNEQELPIPAPCPTAHDGVGGPLARAYANQLDQQYTRRAAVRALSQVRPVPRALVPYLVERLRDRKYTTAPFYFRGADDTAIRGGLDPYDQDVLCDPAHFLSQLQSGDRVVVRALIEAVQNEASFLRGPAAVALWKLDRRPSLVVPVLAEEVRQMGVWISFPSPVYKQQIFETLAEIGPEARAAVPVLTELLASWCESVDDPWAATHGWRVGYWAAETLGRIGPAAEAALPALREALTTEDRHVRLAVALARWRISGHAGEALPALLEALNDPGPGEEGPPWRCHFPRMPHLPRTQQAAAEALGQMGTAARPALPDLRKALQRADPGLIVAAARALWQIGRQAEAAVSALVAALPAADDQTRLAAVQALGQIGPPARAALPALRRARYDCDAAVRAAAQVALRAVDPP
jgi:HEAT repeat protein